jgi:hypothetical protein
MKILEIDIENRGLFERLNLLGYNSSNNSKSINLLPTGFPKYRLNSVRIF